MFKDLPLPDLLGRYIRSHNAQAYELKHEIARRTAPRRQETGRPVMLRYDHHTIIVGTTGDVKVV